MLRNHRYNGGMPMKNDQLEVKTHQADMEVINLVENIECQVGRGKKMQMTQICFIDCLREVNQQKIFEIAEVKKLFKKRIQVLVKAKNYELTS